MFWVFPCSKSSKLRVVSHVYYYPKKDSASAQELLDKQSVVVHQPPVKHEVKMKDFVSWLGRQGRSPAEVILKQKLEKILGKVNHTRT